jgi:hypothetical protein
MAISFFKKRNGEKTEMSFIDHLEELRWHIVRSVLGDTGYGNSHIRFPGLDFQQHHLWTNE